MKIRTLLWLAAAAACILLASCVGMTPEQQASANQAIDHMMQAGVLTSEEALALKNSLSTPWYERAMNGLLWVGATYAGIQISPGIGVKRLVTKMVASAAQGAAPQPEPKK